MESSHQHREPWNKGKLIGQKPLLKLKDIWAIRIHLQNTQQGRDIYPPFFCRSHDLAKVSGSLIQAHNIEKLKQPKLIHHLYHHKYGNVVNCL